MKHTAQILKIGLTVFLFGLLPTVVFTLITSKTGVISGVRSFTVLSGSMEPVLPVGSIIYTIRQQDYSQGDIVSVQSGDATVTHRITKKIQEDGNTFYELKGDANELVDKDLVPKSQIQGKQIAVIPEIGKFQSFIRTPLGFIALIIFPAMLVVGFELWAIKKEIENQTEIRIKKQMMLTT